MAKILFINPVVREEDDPKHIPYGIALLASIAIEKGHQVQVYDANAWRKDVSALHVVCRADNWDVIAIGGLTTTYNYIKHACSIINQASPNSFLIAGGGFMTSMPHEIMKWMPQIDLALIGETFVTFPVVLEKIDQNDLDFSETLGVCYRDKEGNSRLTAVRPNIPDLDVLPWPAWDLFPLDIYFNNSKILYSDEGFTSKRRLDINGSFGCNLICRYCWHLGTTGDMVINPDEEGKNDVQFTYGRNIRYHSPEYIVKMVRHLYETYQIDFASFLDENLFTMDAFSKRTFLTDLSNAWIDAGLQPTCRRDKVPHDENCVGVHWSGTSHASLHRKETLDKMYEAGCSHLVYGLETFDPGLLKSLGKGSTAEKNISSVKICYDSGIIPVPNIIIGFPDESFETIRNTINALLKLGIYAKPHFATPYPGSEWYYTYKDSIIEQYNGDLESFIEDLGDASKITAVISHRFSAMDLLGLQQIVASRDLRLLDQVEKHWGDANKHMVPVAVPRKSFNIIKGKVATPIASKKELN